MVRRGITVPLGVLALAAASAFAADGGGLGRDLHGSECRSEPRFSAPPDPSLPMPVDIYCGQQPQPSGRVEASPLAAPPTGAEGLARAVADSPVSRAILLRLHCDGGGTVEVAGRPALVQSCTMRTGGWRAIRIAVADGGMLVQADGDPAALPVFDRVLRRMLGGGGAEAPADLIRRVERVTGPLPDYDDGAAGAARQFLDIARLYNGEGNFAAAEQADRSALALQSKGLGADDPAIGDTLTRLALEVSNQSRFDEAHSLFQRADPLVRRSPDPLAVPRLLDALATDAMNQRHYAAARDFARRAAAGFAAIAAPSDSPGQQASGFANAVLAEGEQAHSMMVEAAAALHLADWAAAEAAAAWAMSIVDRHAGLPDWWKPDAMTLLGEIEGKLGRVDRGEALIKDAIARYQALFGRSQSTAMAWLALGRLLAGGGRYPAALQAFESGLAADGAASTLSFDSVAPYFTAALDTAAAADTDARDRLMEGVFGAVQRVQMGLARDAISRTAAQFAADTPGLAKLVHAVDESDRDQVATRLALADEAAKPADSRDATRVAWLSGRLQALSAQRQAARRALDQAYPDFARLDAPRLATVAELRRLLGPGEAFVTFAFGQDSGIAVAVTPSRVVAARIALPAGQLARQVASLRQATTVRAGRVGPYDTALAYRLFQELLGPLQPALAGIDSLHVVAPGALASLPLGMLVTAPPGGAALQDVAWLAERFAVTDWPSARAIVTLRNQAAPSRAPLPFLGVGDPAFGRGEAHSLGGVDSQCRADGPFPADLLAELPPLPETGAEVRRIGALLGAAPADILTGKAATEAALRGRPLADYRVLYFATHGLLPAELRCQSQPGLALSPPAQPATTTADDGLLEASEIAGLHLDADLVVLSACDTATAAGRFGGESLSSLAEVFFHAGARGVLASHWAVPSLATMTLMTALFARYAAAPAGGYADALRRAQVQMIHDKATAHPVNWAGFTLIGGLGGERP